MVDVGREMEIIAAREVELHREFTHARFCAAKNHPRAPLPYLENIRLSARQGRETPGYHSVGCYRPSEIERDVSHIACRVPHVILDVDSEVDGKKNLAQALDDALEIISILIAAGARKEGIQALVTGGWGVQLRVADGLFGCPVYRTEEYAKFYLGLFVKRLLKGRPDLLNAVDPACLNPKQIVRSPGCMYDKRPRRSVLMPCAEFLELPRRPEGTAFALTDPNLPVTPVDIRAPSEIEIASHLARLLYDPPSSREPAPPSIHMNVFTVGQAAKDRVGELTERVVNRIMRGVSESQHWGADCGWDGATPGRNSASLQLARHIAASEHPISKEHLVRRLEEWNRHNRPPLPHSELRSTAKSALRYVNKLNSK